MKIRENELHRPDLHRQTAYIKIEDGIHGEVVPCGTAFVLTCVVCGHQWDYMKFDYNYCPNCGARLKNVINTGETTFKENDARNKIWQDFWNKENTQ